MTKQVKEIVISELRNLLELKQEGELNISPRMSLMNDFALSSMGLAELVSSLEMILEVDPFEEAFAITEMETVEDLISAYQSTLNGQFKERDQLNKELGDILSGI